MKAVKKIEISVLYKRPMPLVVYTMQGDTGREIECTVVDWDIPAGATARVWVVKPSKKVVYSEGGIVENSVVFSLTNQMLAEPGVAICIIEFASGDDVVSSFPFNLCIDGSARGDGIPSENESTVLEGMFEALGQDAIKALDAAKAQAAAAKKSAQDTEKIKNDFTLTAQQATADVNNAGQAQTQRVNTAGDTQVSRIQAEGSIQVQNVQATAAEIAADREQIHTNRDNVAQLQRNSAGAITRSAEGSFITLEDAADGMGLRQIEIPGMTEQVATTGAQLFDAGTIIDDVITIHFTPMQLEANTEYTLSSDTAKDYDGAGAYLFFASGEHTGGSFTTANDGVWKSNPRTVISDTNGYVTIIYKQKVNGYLKNGNIMLNQGATALPWEPYTGAAPSPSPAYPQELRNVGRLNEAGKYEVKVTACKNNLLDMTGAKGGTAAGITTTVNPDGTLTSNGTGTGGPVAIWLLGGYRPVTTDNVLMVLQAGKTYYISDVVLFMGTEYPAQYKFFVDPEKYPEGFKVTGVRHAQIDSGTALANKVYHPRVILGDTDTGWEPYRGHTATITPDRPLTEWDKLTYRDGVWGWAYKGITVVEGGNREATGYFYPTIVLPPLAKKMDVNSEVLCNYCSSEYIGKSSNEGTNMCISNADTYWGFSSITDANAWLIQKNAEGNPLYYQYKMQEEEWVPLSPEEQAAMNALCTYAGTTHIWTDDPLQPVISLDYTVDTEGYIRETAPAYRDVEKFALTGEASGTVATCTDSAEWSLLGIGMKGKCEQLTTTGANLFGGRALADKIKEVAPDSIIDEEKGTVTFASNSISGKTLYDNFEAGKRYTIILCGKNTDQSYTATNIRLTYDDDINVSLSFQTANAYSYCVYSSTVDKTVVSMSGTWVTAKTELQYDKCGIFEGAIDLASFEPYTGATPSPSPAYKQEVKETGTYNQAVWRQCGKNLFDMDAWYEYYYAFKRDIFWETIDDRKCLKWRGLSGNDGKFNVFPLHISSGHKIRLSFYSRKQQTSGHDDTGLFLTNKGGTNILGSYAPDTTTWTYTAIETVLKEDCCGLKIAYSNEAYCYFSDISLTVDSDNTEYQPYQSDTLRLTADQPWRGIGDVHDEVCDRDGVLGTWRRYTKDILDGSEDEKWGMADCLDPTHKRFYSYLVSAKAKPAKNNASVEPLLCNAYKAVTANKAYAENQGISVEAATGKVLIYDNTFSLTADISGFKARLAEYPITVVYQLKEPYFEPFPEEIQRAYRKLKSYAGTTHAWVDDPLQPEVSFRYIKDSKLILSKLEDRLTALEAGQAQTAAAFSYLPPEIQAAMIETETRELMNSI